MARFYGKIGYIKTVQTEPGCWEEQTIEKSYYGDLLRNVGKYQSYGNMDMGIIGKVNDNINVNNSISIIADPYANVNFQHMRYVIFMGAKWKINDVEVKYPRLILTLGGLYHE